MCLLNKEQVVHHDDKGAIVYGVAAKRGKREHRLGKRGDCSNDTELKRGDVVLFDIGGRHRNYCSDMTRTFFWGEPDKETARIYDIVRRANEAAEALIAPGVRMCDLDRAARDVIEDAGYGEYFTHRLGHSIGLQDHEPGDVSLVNEQVVELGMTFSIEPGIYLPGRTGIRIEDLVLVTENGVEILNAYPHDPVRLD